MNKMKNGDLKVFIAIISELKIPPIMASFLITSGQYFVQHTNDIENKLRKRSLYRVSLILRSKKSRFSFIIFFNYFNEWNDFWNIACHQNAKFCQILNFTNFLQFLSYDLNTPEIYEAQLFTVNPIWFYDWVAILDMNAFCIFSCGMCCFRVI